MLKAAKLSTLKSVFSSAVPIENRNHFCGRVSQLRDLYAALNQRGSHVVIYGDSGVGKTSLANMAKDALPDAIIFRISCKKEYFNNMWHEVLEKIQLSLGRDELKFSVKSRYESVKLDSFLYATDTLEPDNILHVFENLLTRLIIIFDDFGAKMSNHIRKDMAVTMERLSAKVPNVTIILVGDVAASGLLAGYMSDEESELEERLTQIEMLRMSDNEIGEIIDNGLSKLKLKADDDVRSKIIDCSSSIPQYTHILCENAAWNAIQSDSNEIIIAHFSYAVYRAIKMAPDHIVDAHGKAVANSGKLSLFKEVLAACCSVSQGGTEGFTNSEAFNYFKDKPELDIEEVECSYYLDALCSRAKGSILEKPKSENTSRYKFTDTIMRIFIKLNIYDEIHVVSESRLSRGGGIISSDQF